VPKIYLSLGSNVNREEMLRECKKQLQHHFSDLHISSVYENPAIGFVGDDFYNCVLAFDTELSLEALVNILASIQCDLAGRWDAHQFNDRTIDIDLLLYGDYASDNLDVKLPRADITDYAFVLRPLAELAPNEQHPLLKKTFQELWQAFDQGSHSLKKIDFNWDTA
jgi:2-amino-4-hydroxy-6-hydroxymethyldihydropteridine diphosphokinase